MHACGLCGPTIGNGSSPFHKSNSIIHKLVKKQFQQLFTGDLVQHIIRMFLMQLISCLSHQNEIDSRAISPEQACGSCLSA